MVELEPVEPLLPVRAEQLGSGSLRQRLIGRRVTVFGRLGVAALLQPVGGVLADHLQHEQARFFEIGHPPQQALIGELVEAREHIDAEILRAAHSLDLFETRAACEHRESLEQSLQRFIQQVVAPGDRARERLLPSRQVARTNSEHLQACLEPAEQRLRCKKLDPRRGQLDGQRQPVDAFADAGDGRRVLVGGLEVRLHRHRTLDEELDRLILRQRRQRWQRAQVGQAKRLDRQLLLAVDPKHGAAAHHGLQTWSRVQQIGHDLGAVR